MNLKRRTTEIINCDKTWGPCLMWTRELSEPKNGGLIHPSGSTGKYPLDRGVTGEWMGSYYNHPSSCSKKNPPKHQCYCFWKDLPMEHSITFDNSASKLNKPWIWSSIYLILKYICKITPNALTFDWFWWSGHLRRHRASESGQTQAFAARGVGSFWGIWGYDSVGLERQTHHCKCRVKCRRDWSLIQRVMGLSLKWMHSTTGTSKPKL